MINPDYYNSNNAEFVEAFNMYCDINFETAQLCELNVAEFACELFSYRSFKKLNSFKLIVLNKFGQLKLLCLTEYSYSKRPSLLELFEAQERISEECLIITTFYPELSSNNSSEENRASILSKENYKQAVTRAHKVIDSIYIINKMHLIELDRYLASWVAISKILKQTILFGVKARV